jgi:hypothetical protein
VLEGWTILEGLLGAEMYKYIKTEKIYSLALVTVSNKYSITGVSQEGRWMGACGGGGGGGGGIKESKHSPQYFCLWIIDISNKCPQYFKA